MKLRPLGDRIVVQRVAASETTKGGILLPDAAKNKPLKPGKAYQQSGKAKGAPSWRVAASDSDYLRDPDGADEFFHTAREAEQAFRSRPGLGLTEERLLSQNAGMPSARV